MHNRLETLLAATHPGVIAIDGPSGSGKTTYADVVADELARRTGTRPQIVHMDDIYPGWDGLAEAPELAAEWVLRPFSAGRDGGFRRWDWAAGERGEHVTVPHAQWLILEGVGSGSAVCREHLGALIWVEADAGVRRARGIARDGEAYRPFWERWASQEQALFTRERTRAHADLMIRT